MSTSEVPYRGDWHDSLNMHQEVFSGSKPHNGADTNDQAAMPFQFAI